jgi:hypothetical protein
VARIGTKRRPAVVRVASEERALQILDLCIQHGIQVIAGIEPNQREDVSDVERNAGTFRGESLIRSC